jgi:5-methylcytosine-specific restriction enzyme subunit McrC
MAETGHTVEISLAEWERVGPAEVPALHGLTLDATAAAQAKALGNKLSVRPGFGGVEVEAVSHVGYVAIGPLRIAVQPKLPALPLTRLLRYAYGLRDLGPPLDQTAAPLAVHGLHDILVALLAAEAEELLHRGLARQYVTRNEWLENPRGRIMVGDLVRRGGVLEARLPCRHTERRTDWRLNQVLRAGLRLAEEVAGDPELRRRVQRLHAMMDGVAAVSLDGSALDVTERSLTRLTAAYAPALTLVRLLLDAQGIAVEPGRTAEVPGFLFDMNSFFQRLVSRFLHDNLPSDQHIQDERSVHGLLAYAPATNPQNRLAPRVRPDYALVEGKAPQRFLDAKYRDVWNRNCPPEWLYQLSLYALASPGRVSVLLYGTTDEAALEERVEIRPPATGGRPVAATVVFRPVLLPRLAELVGAEGNNSRKAERRWLAARLVAVQGLAGAAC